MEQVFYNQDRYNLEITISRVLEDGFTDKLVIGYDNISQLTIMNDLADPLPTLQLSVKDPEGIYISKYPIDGKSFINVYLEYLGNEDNSDNTVEFSHNFIIDDVEIITKTNEEITYLIKGVSEVIPMWFANVEYSTKENLTSTTKIITQLLRQTKIKFDIDNDFRDSSKKINYISPSQTPIKNCIDYLLYMSNSDVDGIFFIPFKLIDNKFRLINAKQLFNKGDIKDYNAVKIPTKRGFSNMEEISFNLNEFNFINGSKLYDYYEKTILNNFDYINRKWSQNIFDNNRLKKFLSKNPNDIEKMNTIFKDIPLFYKRSAKFIKEYDNRRFLEVSEYMRDIFNYLNVIQYDCTGYLKREVGDLYLVGVDDSTQPLYNKYVGTWMISRIYNIFSKGKFQQNISLVKTHKIKDLVEE